MNNTLLKQRMYSRLIDKLKNPFFFKRKTKFRHITDMPASRWLTQNKITHDQKLSVSVVIHTAQIWESKYPK